MLACLFLIRITSTNIRVKLAIATSKVTCKNVTTNGLNEKSTGLSVMLVPDKVTHCPARCAEYARY